MLQSRTLAALAVALTAAATAASAATGNENDAITVTHAKVSLTQAIQTAEQHAHGRASRAEYENTKQGPAYDVEVVNGQKVLDVKVDAQDGSVLASTQDPVDQGDDHGEDRADHGEEGDDID